MGITKIKRSLFRGIKFLVYKIIFPAAYRFGACRTVNQKKVVFIEQQGEKLSSSFELLKDKLEEEKKYSIHVCFLQYKKNSFSYYKRCLKLLFTISDAAYLFVNDSCNVLGAFKIRKGSKMIQTWHACGAFKKWGFSAAQQEYGESYEEMVKYPYHRNYTLVTVSSPEVVWAYEEAFQASAQVVKPLGVSRTDMFFRKSFQKEAGRKLREKIPAANTKKCILYMPTFRGSREQADGPSGMDYQYLNEKLGSDFILIVKQHPFVQKTFSVPAGAEQFVYDESGLTTEEMLYAAELCVTDYSSVIFEYSLMERPIIFFAYDLEEYYDNRGFYYDYCSFVPGPVVYTLKELVDEIKKADQEPMKWIPGVKKFREKFMSACDGNATERILHEVLKDG